MLSNMTQNFDDAEALRLDSIYRHKVKQQYDTLLSSISIPMPSEDEMADSIEEQEADFVAEAGDDDDDEQDQVNLGREEQMWLQLGMGATMPKNSTPKLDSTLRIAGHTLTSSLAGRAASGELPSKNTVSGASCGGFGKDVRKRGVKDKEEDEEESRVNAILGASREKGRSGLRNAQGKRPELEGNANEKHSSEDEPLSISKRTKKSRSFLDELLAEKGRKKRKKKAKNW